MSINFPLILVIACLITGGIWLLDAIFLAPKRQKSDKPPFLTDYARSFFPILFIVLLVRSFLFEPFRIPSGSLEPTLLVGDFILVNKYTYGLRLPVLNTKFLNIGQPQRGDIVVFHWPPNPSFDYIKRIIGVPGDKVSYIDKVIYINGKPMPQSGQEMAVDHDEFGNIWPVTLKHENLGKVTHDIYQRSDISANDFRDLVVPAGHYFVMGDNRDNSQDSRYWGFVPEKNLVGKAMFVWMSWDSSKSTVRWDRIGRSIH